VLKLASKRWVSIGETVKAVAEPPHSKVGTEHPALHEQEGQWPLRGGEFDVYVSGENLPVECGSRFWRRGI